MAEINVQTVTMGELAEIYSTEQNLSTKMSLGSIIGKYKDMPAIEFFDETGDDLSLARKTIKQITDKQSEQTLKTALKNLRYLSNRLYQGYPKGEAPDFLIPNSANVPKAALDYFGIKEPPKGAANLHLSNEPQYRQQFFKGLMKYAAKNPDDIAAVRAILVEMSTGLRPNAVLGLTVDEYIADKGALYIPPEKKGAKGRNISVPLNRTADSMIQQQLRDFKDSIGKSKRVFVNPNGKPITTGQINKILEQIRVPKIIYDADNNVYYDYLKPKGVDISKLGTQMFRNWHATFADKEGIDPLVAGKLQGRSVESIGKKKSTGEQFRYVSRYPGDVSDYERTEANKFSDVFDVELEDAIKEARKTNPDFSFDYGGGTDRIQERITQRTEGYGDDYFSRPVTEEVPETSTQVETAEKPKMDDAAKKGVVNKILKGFGKGTAVLAPIAIGIGAAEKAQAAEQEIEQGAPVLPTIVGKTAEFIYEDVSPLSLPGQMAEALGDVQPATEEEALSDPEAFTKSDVGMIRRQQQKDKLKDKDSLQNFLSEDLIQP